MVVSAFGLTGKLSPTPVLIALILVRRLFWRSLQDVLRLTSGKFTAEPDSPQSTESYGLV